MASKIGKNIAANSVGKIWTALASLVFVPIYIKLLGEEAYGIVTFFSVMQSVLNLMGVGLQKTLRREFANTAENVEIEAENKRKYMLLRSCEIVYFGVCFIIIIICSFGSSFIANNWLNYENLNPSDVALTISLMGISIGLQLIANLYQGCIFGLDFQGTANALQVIWVTLKNVGVIIVLYFVSKNIVAYYAWHVLIDILYCIATRVVVIKKIPFDGSHSWHFKNLSNLKNVWKYALGLFIISIGSVLNTQLDKVVMSRYLSVIDCGAYNSTYHLASFASYVPTIVGTAIFSNISSLIYNNKNAEAETIFESSNRKSVIVVSAMSAFIAVFAYEILVLWTGSSTYGDIMKYAAPMVVIGLALNAFQQVPYDYLLAAGNTKVNEIQLLCCIPYVLIVTFNLTKKYGVNGAAIAWIIEMLISTTIYLYFFHRISFGKGSMRWVLKNVYLVFALSFIPALALRYLLSLLGTGVLLTVILAVLTGGITLIGLLWLFDRDMILSVFSKLRKRANN